MEMMMKKQLLGRNHLYILLLFLSLTGLNSTNAQKPRHFVVIAGVSNYKHDDLIKDLNFCDDDAYRLYAYFKSEEGGSLPDSQIKILVDEAATTKNIIQTMNTVFSKAGEDDMISFFFSGHGGPGYFCPYDFKGTKETILAYVYIKYMFKQFKTKYKICMADACYSGGITLPSNLQLDAPASTNNTNTEVGIIMSSSPKETSAENFKIRQGAFSFYLIRGLKGKADLDKDKVVTIEEIYKYVKANVMNFTGNKQTPYIEGNINKDTPFGFLR